MSYDLHVHSNHSKDSLLSPNMIVKIARKKGLSGVAITDHDTITGAMEVKTLNRDENFAVIIGQEIKTEFGDVVGLFLTNRIKKNGFWKVLDEITRQNGVSVMAHPYRGYSYPEKIIDEVDLVEVFNSRSTRYQNLKAAHLAERYNKPISAGSDAHSFFEIGRGITFTYDDVRESLIKGKTTIKSHSSNYYFAHGLSFLIERIRQLL